MNVKKRRILLGMIIAIGGLFRVMRVGWGYPYILHPDEPIIIKNAIDLLERHSYEVMVYFRPDHFEIKWDALIFNIYSWLRFHAPATEMYEAHSGDFMVLARLFTVFWGILMIPFMYKILKKIKGDSAGLIGAGILAVAPVFVFHSSLATPDIPLACMVLLIFYFSIFYLEKGEVKYLVVIAALTGISITIKYSGGINCLIIAIVVIMRNLKEKEFLKIIQQGILSIAVVLAVMFVISPNLFTNFAAVYEAFRTEAVKKGHLGIRNLGYWGNICYYTGIMLDQFGYLCLFFIGGGILD